MSQKIGLLATLRPKLDGIRQGVDGLAVAADETATKINVFEVMLFRLKVGDLANVVAARRWSVPWSQNTWIAKTYEMA